MTLKRDRTSEVMQILTPIRVEPVTATQEWTPDPNDEAFCITVDQGIKINGGTEFQWNAGVPLGIAEGYKFTFSVTSTILVM